MGSTSFREFKETTDDFVLIARYITTRLGGHWCGYLGRKDRQPIPLDAGFHFQVSTRMTTDTGIQCVGFDTLHAGDANIGPEGQDGCKMNITRTTIKKIWTKSEVFTHLYHVASLVKQREQEELDQNVVTGTGTDAV